MSGTFLKISGLSGSVDVSGYAGDFDVQSVVDGGTLQDGTGRPVLLPVTVELLESDPGALTLLNDAVTGATLSGVVEIDFTSSGVSGLVTTGAILLSGASVVQDLVQVGGASVTLDYTQLEVETLQSGQVMSSHIYRAPVASGLAAPPTAPIGTEVNVGALYLQVAGVSGTPTNGTVSTGGYTNPVTSGPSIGDPLLGGTTSSDTTSSGTTSSATTSSDATSGSFNVTSDTFAVTSGGVATPLVVTVQQSPTGAGQVGLFADMLKAETISSVQLTTSTGVGTESIVLSNAVLTSDEMSGDQTTLTFDYASATLTTTSQAGSGTTVTLPGTSAAPAPPNVLPGTTSATYLQVSGLNGVEGGGIGSSGDFTVEAIADGGAVTGTTGTRSLLPVTVEIPDDSTGALELLTAAVTGATLPGVVEIGFTSPISSSTVTTGAILLEGATVVQDVVEGGGALVTLDYTRLTVETLSGHAVVSGAGYSPAPGTLVAAPVPTLSPAAPEHYAYLSAAGVTGPTGAGTLSGVFELTGDAFAVTSGGAATPLVVTLAGLPTASGQVALLSGLITGEQYAMVQLGEFLNTSTGIFVSQTVVLSNAVLVSDEASGNDATLTFDYTGATVTYVPQNADGTSGTAEMVTLPGTTAAPAATTPAPGATGAVAYLHVSGLSGEVTASGTAGDFAVSASVAGGVVPDGSDGQPELLPVTLQLSDLSPGAQGLLQAAATGSALPGVVEIDFTRTISGGAVATGTMLLSGATVVQDLVEGGGAAVTLDYTGLTVETLRSGQVVSSASYTVPQAATLMAPSVASLSAAVPISGGTTLQVTGANGPVSSGTTRGLLDVSGYAFAVTSGGTAGPLTVTLSGPVAGAGQIDLFDDFVLKHRVTTVELDDTSTDSAGNTFVYEKIVLSNATVVQDTQADGVSTLVFDYTSAAVTYTPENADGSAGTPATVDLVACYARSTHILTDRGEVPAGDLAIGDVLITASGDRRAIKWIGRRSYAGRFLAANPGVRPVRFTAGSLGDGLPCRDLLVSPEHAMFLDGLLIPARCLVNGSSIRQDRTLDRIDYVHVELATHDVLLAEGAPSESFMDDDSRGVFHNAAEFNRLYPEAVEPAGFCAPRVEHGAELESIRRRLTAVAGNLAQAA